MTGALWRPVGICGGLGGLVVALGVLGVGSSAFFVRACVVGAGVRGAPQAGISSIGASGSMTSSTSDCSAAAPRRFLTNATTPSDNATTPPRIPRIMAMPLPLPEAFSPLSGSPGVVTPPAGSSSLSSRHL